MDKRQRDISESGQVGGYSVPSDWEVTPVQKERVYTEEDMYKAYTAEMSFSEDAQSVMFQVFKDWLEKYNNQKQ